MAAPAGAGNVGVIDRRCRISGGESFMRAAVAVLAVGSGSRTGLGWPGVHGTQVSLLLGLVASGAGDLFRRGVMGQALHVGVAIDAAKEPPVERMLQFVFIDEEADLLAVFIGVRDESP